MMKRSGRLVRKGENGPFFIYSPAFSHDDRLHRHDNGLYRQEDGRHYP